MTRISLGSLWEARVRSRIRISRLSRRWRSKRLFDGVRLHYLSVDRCGPDSLMAFTGLTFAYRGLRGLRGIRVII